MHKFSLDWFIFLVTLHLMIFLDPDPTACLTTDGIPCVFPFIFGNNTYKECITFSDPEQLPWCSTKVNQGTSFHLI